MKEIKFEAHTSVQISMNDMEAMIIIATGNMIPAYIKRTGNQGGRRSDMPTYIQLVYFRHVEIQLVNGAFQFASVDLGMDQIPMLPCDCFPL